MQKIYDLISNYKLVSLLDLGANVGHFSCSIKNMFEGIDLFMVEANPFCDDSLKLTNIPFTIACLSDKEKEVDFYLEDTNQIGTGNSYYLEKTLVYSKKRSIKIKTQTLDSLILKEFGHYKQFDIIKIDTQGSEIDIINGGKKILENAKFVIAETSLIEYNENSPLQEDFFRYMKCLSFIPKEKIEDHYHQGQKIQEDWIFEKV
jgi:FkbM family methyltransferase